jgi:signal transduction histidine kinase
MKLAADLLGSDLSAEEELEVREMVVRNTARLDSIVNTILNFSVMGTGKVKYKRQKLDVNYIVTQAVGRARERAKVEGLRMQVKSGKVPGVKGDAFWLGVVLDNVIDNAIKFTKKGGITITTEERNGGVVVAVSDTGIGVRGQDIKKAFHKFVKMRPHIQGTGVGLWTCKQIVEAHGGEIVMESKGPGKGATVEFWLPAK